MTEKEHTPLTKYEIKEISEMAAKTAIIEMLQRLGIEDISKTRRNLDYLDKQVQATESRVNEGRKTLFTIIGGLVVGLVTYLATVFTIKGH